MASTHVAFDPKPLRLGAVINMICGTAAIYAGDVVAFEASPSNMTVSPSVGTTTGVPIGVALHGATVGQKVAVASVGSIVKVKDGGSGIDAGDELQTATVDGTVDAFTGVAQGFVIGYALADITAESTGYAFITGGHTVQKLT